MHTTAHSLGKYEEGMHIFNECMAASPSNTHKMLEENRPNVS
jgi:hypothetical protein